MATTKTSSTKATKTSSTKSKKKTSTKKTKTPKKSLTETPKVSPKEAQPEPCLKGATEISELSKIWETAPDVSDHFKSSLEDVFAENAFDSLTSSDSPKDIPLPGSNCAPLARDIPPIVEGTDPFEIQTIHKAWASGTIQDRQTISQHPISGAFPFGCILLSHVLQWMTTNGWTKSPIQPIQANTVYSRTTDDKVTVIVVPNLDGTPEYHPSYGKLLSSLLYQLSLHHDLSPINLIYAVAGKNPNDFKPANIKPPEAVGYIIVDSLRPALDIGITQLDAGDFIEGTPAELARALRSQ